MKKKIILQSLVIAFLSFCSPKTENNQQLILATDFNIVSNSQDTLTFISLKNNKYKLIDAYYNCTITDTSTINIQKGKINSCHKILKIENDTVKIPLPVGSETTKLVLGGVILVAKDSVGKYYYQKFRFDID